MKIRIVQIDPDNGLGPDKTLSESPVPDSGGAVVLTDNVGMEMTVEAALGDDGGFVLSADGYEISLVPEESATFKVVVRRR